VKVSIGNQFAVDRCRPRNQVGKVALAGLLSAMVLLVGVVCSCQSEPESQELAAGSAGIDSVRSQDGVMIHYSEYGSGEQALVFVHCWSCDRSYWDPVVERLTDDYHLVTVDLAGHGDSGGDREEWSM
jgi:hypothetical protein